MKIETYIEQKKIIIDEALLAYLPKPTEYPAAIHEAMHYSVAAGGKRLRPILAIAAGEAVGGCDPQQMLPLLCALEYIHTYSLIHDDLPAMDDDDFRRGQLSCHMVFGEGIAILAGDALLTYAFELLTTLGPPHGVYDNSLILNTIAEISRAIGTRGLIGGQVVDLQSEESVVDKKTLEYIHQHKTGALFKTSVVTGGMLCGANQEQLQSLERYANALGLAFQITDDILDIEGDALLLGKPVGSDEEKHKATYPNLWGLDEARNLVEQCVTDALDALAAFDYKGNYLRELAIYIGQRNS